MDGKIISELRLTTNSQAQQEKFSVFRLRREIGEEWKSPERRRIETSEENLLHSHTVL
jgi:hypothetical protein